MVRKAHGQCRCIFSIENEPDLLKDSMREEREKNS
jgi:hypothetical protein